LDPVTATLSAGMVTSLTLVMHRNGSASVSLYFQDGVDAGPPGPDAGAPVDTAAAETSLGCTTPTTCPGTDTECSTRTCLAGQCGISHATDGVSGGRSGGGC